MGEGTVAHTSSPGRAGSWIGRRRAGRIGLSAVAVLAAPVARAATYTWDVNGPAAGTGGTGSWNTTAGNNAWTADGATYGPWPTTGPNTALFGGTAGTVTVTTPITTAGLTFAANGYTIAGTSTLTFNTATPTINTGGYNATFAPGVNTFNLSGASTVYKTGLGTLTLGTDQRNSLGSNITWNVSGGTVDPATGLYNSTIAFVTAQPLGSSTGSVLALDGATFAFTANGGAGYATGRAIAVGTSGGAISDGGFAPGLGTTGGSTIAPTITVAAGPGLNLVANNVLDLDAGSIAGAGSVNVYGTGVTRILSTSNTYTGGTSIAAGGTLFIAAAKSIGQTTPNVTVAGTLNLNANTLAAGRFVSNNGAVDFNVSSGGVLVNALSATSAAVSGTTRIVLAMPTINSIPAGSTYTPLTSPTGGLSGSYVGSFLVPGGQNLSVPVNAVFHSVGGTLYRETATAAANAAGTAVTVTAVDTPAPVKTLTVFPLGSSITEGDSAQSPYDGGGYRSQLYQNLANDGRFTPLFVGSNTGTGANNPAGADLATTVGQGRNEGHSGYTTGAILANLTSNYLAPGNGVNPDVVTLNVGGNDYVANNNDTTAITRLGQIVDTVESLRPNATVIVSSVLYRGDNGGGAGNGIVNLYDPLIPALVYQRILAGEHVSYLDAAALLTPNKSLAFVGPDLIHPTQAGYNLFANAWYQSVTTGQAFYTGKAGAAWNAGGNGATSFAMDFQRTTDSGVLPAANTDVYFNGGGTGGTVPLGADFAVRGVNFAAGATTPVTISGPNTLTLGPGGITVQSGAAAHTIAAPVALAAAQTWANVSANRFTVSGTVTGSAPLTVGVAGGTGVIVLSGNNAYTGGTTLAGGTLVAANTAGSATGTAGVTVASGATLTGTGSVLGPVVVNGTITAGLADGSLGTLATVGQQTWAAGGRFFAAFNADGSAHDRLTTDLLSVAPGGTFTVAVTSPGSPAIDPSATYVLATDADPSPADPFFPATFAVTTMGELNLTVAGLRPADGFKFALAAQPDGTGYDLVLRQASAAIPEPAAAATAAGVAAARLLGRRRRRA